MRKILFAVVLLGVGIPQAWGQPAPQGAPFSVTHFTAQDYRAQSQNWGIAQDDRGLIYVANNDGILQYDGARWRLIETDANTFARSVAADSQGTVYAGAVGDFGVLRPDSTATLRYVSLSKRLPPEERDFKDVWKTHTAGDEVYFQARKRLFRWDGDTLRSWKSEVGFHTSFVVRGTLYVRDGGRGLLRMEGDSLKLASGGQRFADVPIFVMVPYEEGQILVGTREQGFLLYDGRTFTSFPTQADPLLAETRLYHGRVLPGGEIALATLGGGVLIINHEGQLVRVLNQDTTLPDGVVNYVYPDDQGGLWMALHNQGVVRAEVSSPLSRFGKGFGLEGIVYDLHRHEETLYAATGAGLYTLEVQNEASRVPYQFEKVPGMPLTWELLSAGGTLFAATDIGIYRVQGGTGRKLADCRSFSLTMGEGQPSRLYVGTSQGLGVLQREGGGWSFQLLVPTQSEVRVTTLTDRGRVLWFSTLSGSLFRLSSEDVRRLERQGQAAVQPQHFGRRDGLPGGHGIITSFQGRPLFVSKKGLYRMRSTATDTTFYSDTALSRPGAISDSLRAFYEDPVADGGAWLFYNDRVEIARPRPDGTYDHTAPPALQFPRDDIVRALVESNGSAWIGNGDELIRYDAVRAERLQGAAQATSEVLIRRVRDATTDEIIYGGDGASQAPVEVPYRQNSVRIAFALPEYQSETPQLYQYRLKGKEGWSNWHPNAEAVLRNLYEGTYTFQVRARNADGRSISQASLTLNVLPPWYRTIWAYLSYLTVAVLLAAGYRHYRHLKEESRRAQRQERELEREREARVQLRKAHDRLEEANRLKENFLANTSHEFRTPLATIMGYAEVLQTEDLPREQQQEFLNTIRRSGDRLLNTVDMLLEVAKLRAGALQLEPSNVEVNAAVKEAVMPFHEKAMEAGLTFRFSSSPAPIQAQLPVTYVQRIIENLVDNAIKFTADGGVRVAVRDEGDDVHVAVQDTGVGLEESQVEKLFDEFKQASEGISREYEGIGLGLTIAGRLARLMGGSISVESMKGKGSIFTVCLPKEPEVGAAPES